MHIQKGGMMEEFPTLFEWLLLNYTDYLPPNSQLSYYPMHHSAENKEKKCQRLTQIYHQPNNKLE